MDSFLRNTLVDRRTWQTPICPICGDKTVRINPITTEFSCSKRHYVTHRLQHNSFTETRYIDKYTVIFSILPFADLIDDEDAQCHISITVNPNKQLFNDFAANFPQLITTTDIENFLLLS